MTILDRLPRPVLDRPHYDDDGIGVFHVLGTVFGVVMFVLVLAAIVTLLWNSFATRAEMRALSDEVRALRQEQASHTASHGATDDASAGATPTPPGSVSADASAAPAPKPKPEPKPKRAPRKKPTDPSK